ncbi:MAG: HAD-IA family hydrolase [Sandaracinaceae bacterium]|nr:HAD-IA family hydrolase [Sandaracinaceae bacterium]
MDAILFDLDGTLLDTNRLYAAAYHHAFTTELTTPPTMEMFAARRPASERLFLLEWYGEQLGDRLHRRVVEHYAAHAATLMGGLYEGVREMLDEVLARDLRVAIVTGKSRLAYEVTCEHVDLSAFEVVIVEDDVPAAKPDPAGILKAHAALGGGEAVYVGDTPMDAEAAVAAGLQPAAALWCRPPSDRERVAATLADGVWPLLTPADLLSRL